MFIGYGMHETGTSDRDMYAIWLDVIKLYLGVIELLLGVIKLFLAVN